MAKGRSRRNRNFVAIPFLANITVATLANDTLLSAAILTLTEDLFVMSIDAQWQLRGVTVGEGPVGVGFAHGDLSDTEMLEALDASAPGPDDIIAIERARRPVRRSGFFPAITADEVLDNGITVRTKCKFSVGDGNSIDVWVVNRSGATMTTGALIKCSGTIFGRWQR